MIKVKKLLLLVVGSGIYSLLNYLQQLKRLTNQDHSS